MANLKVRVNRKGPESLTRQITNQIAGLINTGVLAAGQFLPSERELAESLGVARNVVRRSYNYLTSSALIQGEGRRGRSVRSASSRKGSSTGGASASKRRGATGRQSSKKSSSGKGSKKAGQKPSKAGSRKGR